MDTSATVCRTRLQYPESVRAALTQRGVHIAISGVYGQFDKIIFYSNGLALALASGKGVCCKVIETVLDQLGGKSEVYDKSQRHILADGIG